MSAKTNTKTAWISAGSVVVAAMIGAGWFTFFRTTTEISGQVIEAITLRPILHADVSVVGRNENDSTDGNGHFKLSFKDLPHDTREVRVVIAKTGYETSERSVSVSKTDWVIEMVRHVDVTIQPPRPNDNIPTPALQITAQPIKIDFTTQPNGGPRPGCACGERDISFPRGPYEASVNEEFVFRYENPRICRGQAFVSVS